MANDAELDALVARAKDWVRRTEEWGAATEFVSDLTNAITALREELRGRTQNFDDACATIARLEQERDAARAEVDSMRALLRDTKYVLGDWDDGQEPHTHYCPTCDNSIDGNRTLRDRIDAALREGEK